jgi:hypothetical protein
MFGRWVSLGRHGPVSEERQLVTGSLRWTALAVVAVAALGACSGGGSAAPAGQNDPASSTPGAASSHPAGRTAQPVGAITQDRLQGALLGGFADLTPITAPQNGSYSSLPAAQIATSTEAVPAGATVAPAKCRSALWSGPRTNAYGSAAATVVAYRKQGDTSPAGVQAWEELIASAGRSAQEALGTGPVAGCDTVKVSYQGNTLGFAEQRPPSLGQGSRGAVLTPSSKGSRQTRLTTFVGNGYVGVVFLQGKVTKDQLDAFASAAYKNAAQKLG